MTIDDIKAMTDACIKPKHVCAVLGWSTSKFIGYARKGELPFPVVAPDKKGAPVKISRIGFINWYENRKEEKKDHQEEILAEVHQVNTGLKAMSLLMLRALRTIDEEGFDEMLAAADAEGGMKQ